MYLQCSFATNWKASTENWKVLFENAEGFVQRALALYVPKSLKNGAALLWNLGINFKDAYRTSGTMRAFLIWNTRYVHNHSYTNVLQWRSCSSNELLNAIYMIRSAQAA